MQQIGLLRTKTHDNFGSSEIELQWKATATGSTGLSATLIKLCCMIEGGLCEMQGALHNKPLEFNITISVVVPCFCTTTKWSVSNRAGSIRQLCILLLLLRLEFPVTKKATVHCCSLSPPLFSNCQSLSRE